MPRLELAWERVGGVLFHELLPIAWRPGRPVEVRCGRHWKLDREGRVPFNAAEAVQFGIGELFRLAREEDDELEIRRRMHEERWGRRDDEAECVIERARKYIAKIDPALAGRCGRGLDCNSYQSTIFRVAVVLVRGFALDYRDSSLLLREYGARCTPKFADDRRLRRKLVEAHKSGRMEFGMLLSRRGGRAA